VDLNPQPRYCGEAFHQGDALAFLRNHGHEFDAIHASPPCQCYTMMRRMGKGAGKNAVELVVPVRRYLKASGRPYVIENVVGSQFELHRIRRHRLFETSFAVVQPKCQHSKEGIYGVYGDHPQDSFIHTRPLSITSGGFNGKTMSGARRPASIEQAREVMGIDWMVWKEITQAIPPAYTEYIGRVLALALQPGMKAAA
jgi:DNA (cytosine-5)-methyltransferase 1